MLYPVKIEFKEYPSGSWADWSQYLAEAPVISKKVESENEGEAGVIVFDNASVSFRYDSSNPVYSAFSIDLSSKQRYLFRISAVKTDKTYKQLFEGMADFSTIRWPDPDEGKLIAFDCVDKLSALGMLSSELTRTETTLNARVLAQTPSAFYLVADLPSATELRLYSSFDAEGNNPYYFTSPIVFPGELIRDPQSWGGSEPRYLVVLESRMITSGNVYNQVITTPRINPVTFLDPYPLASNKCTYLSKEVFGVDINNVTGEVLDNLDGLKIIEVFYKQAWSGATVILKPPALVYNVPAPYALRIQGSSPFAATTLDALKIFADSLLPAAATNYGCYIYVNNNGDLVLQTKEDLSTNGTTRSIGTTKIVSKPEKKYFWNKLVDGVTVEVKSWITDEFGDYLVGTSAQSKQIPGNTSSVKPKNEITKELLTSNATEDTQAELDARAATVASAILDFYGKRKSAFDLELNIDDNTLDWELVDNMTLDSIQCFFTQMEFDLVERVLKLEPVEITGHDYDFRQIVIGLSQANSIGYSGGGTTYIGSGGGQGGINYLFASPLLNTAGTVTLEMTGNFKITSSQLDTIQDILTTSTPTFNQVILASAGSSTQAVRADRTVLAAYPLTGGGDLTADRNLSLQFNAPLINSANYLALDLAAPMILSADKLTLDYNTTNLKLTSNKLNTIQDIAVTSSPTFTNLTLSGVITVNGTGSNYFEGRVGLGVTPQLSTKLQVEGNIFVSGGDRVILNYSNNYLGLGTNNTERMRIAAGGNVGINITSPNVALEVGGNVHVSGGDRTIFNRSNNYLAFGTNNTEAFRIKNDLNVGFGITNPVEKIHLAGHLKQDGSYSLYNNFTSGWTGSGWRVDYNITNPSESTVEADNMFLRGSLTVYELIINQIRASRGTVYITPANGRIETVTGTPPEEVITIEDPTGNGYIYFAANDIVIVQKVDLDNTTIIKRIVRKVDTVSAGNVYLVLLSGAPADVGTLEPGDDLISFGNTTNTSRQGSLYLTSDDSNAPFMDIIDDVDSWSAWKSPAKLKARLGKLDGITDTVFGTLTDYGLYTTRLYLSSKSTSTGIALYADNATSKLTMYQSGNIIFNFDTASSTAKIAGWNFDNTKLYNGAVIVLDSSERKISVSSDAVKMFYTTALNYGIKDSAGKFWLGSTNQIAGWTFDTTKLYKGTDIVLDSSSKKVAVYSDAVKMYYTGDGDYGIKDSAGKFWLGSTNQIAGWNFDTTKLYNGPDIVLDSSAKKVSVNSDAVKMYFTAEGDYGIKDSAGKFWLGSTNQIAGWNFDTVKLTKGTATAGFSLNTSSTPFITGASAKGFEVYDVSNPKVFLGKKDGNFLDWNVTTANVLTLKGSIDASTITGSKISTSTEFSILTNTFAALADLTGTNPKLLVSYYGSSTNRKYLSIAPASASNIILYAYAQGTGVKLSEVSIEFPAGNQEKLGVYINGYPSPRFRGNAASNPTTDLREGDTYWNTGSSNLRMYGGSAWRTIS